MDSKATPAKRTRSPAGLVNRDVVGRIASTQVRLAQVPKIIATLRSSQLHMKEHDIGVTALLAASAGRSSPPLNDLECRQRRSNAKDFNVPYQLMICLI